VFIVLIGVTGYFLSDKILKSKYLLYGVFTFLGVLSIIFRNVPVSLPVNEGFLGFSFFYVVMITGVFNRESQVFKRLYSIRSIFSIIGFIILTPHAVFYFVDKFVNNGLFDIVGLLAYLVMIPLFITSFQKVDKPEVMFKWKKLQRFAYLAYLLIFVHLVLVSKMPNTVMYIVLFVPYILYKPYHFFKHEKPYLMQMKKKLNQKKEMNKK
jgi:DMSO/TMAO reductase YedYZ heme-binding membrane subunit